MKNIDSHPKLMKLHEKKCCLSREKMKFCSIANSFVVTNNKKCRTKSKRKNNNSI